MRLSRGNTNDDAIRLSEFASRILFSAVQGIFRIPFLSCTVLLASRSLRTYGICDLGALVCDSRIYAVELDISVWHCTFPVQFLFCMVEQRGGLLSLGYTHQIGHLFLFSFWHNPRWLVVASLYCSTSLDPLHHTLLTWHIFPGVCASSVTSLCILGSLAG
jgi:hypothetical protein